MSNTEWRVWLRLRGKQLAGFKFRRQLAIGPYFADFACVAARLVVEIDGPLHAEESDRRKDEYLASEGFRVARFPVGEVDQAIEDVISTIFRELESPHPAVPFGQRRPPRRAGR
jgi:very-short-patch-repair endonuclease